MALAWTYGRPVRGYAWTIAGAAAALALALELIHLTAGVTNYWHWTVQFAATRRLPPLADLLAMYDDPQQLWRIAAFLGGALLLSLNYKGRPALVWLSILLLSSPFLWTVIALWIESDSSDRAEELLDLWPFLLVVSLASALAAAVWSFRPNLSWSAGSSPDGIALVLPFVLIATVHGAFLSQQVWGSTYALWPLFMLLCAGIFSVLFPASPAGTSHARATYWP